MRKVFLDKIPIFLNGHNKNKIDWNSSINMDIDFIYDNIVGKFKIINYQNNYLTIIYKNNITNIFTGHFKNANIGNVIKIKTSEFKIEIGTRFKDDKRDITIIDRKIEDYIRNNGKIQKQKYYKYTCNKCGWTDGWMEESQLLSNRKCGCACCCKPTKIIVEGINDIPTTAPWMVKYFVGGYEEAKKYSCTSHQYIYPMCPDCGRVKDTKVIVSNIYNNKSIGCRCGDGFSYGHKYIFNLLSQLNQQFIDNYTFYWCKFYNSYKEKEVTGEYDFILEDIKTIIEVDGGFHRRDNNMNGQTKEESKFIDDYKDKLAQEHGYKVIRISDEGDVKQNIISSDLSNVFNISDINWTKCEVFALKNIIKEVCILWENNKSMKLILDLYKISGTTVRKYLTIGNSFNWCNYDSKTERNKGLEYGRKSKRKSVEIFKNNVSIGIFTSTMELERRSEELFGTKLSNSKISQVCNGKKIQYKGFTFEFIVIKE